jgi:hypothetical protein
MKNYSRGLTQRDINFGFGRMLDEIADLLGTEGNVSRPIAEVIKDSEEKHTDHFLASCYNVNENVPMELYRTAEKTLARIRAEYSGRMNSQPPQPAIVERDIPPFAFFEIVKDLLRREEYSTVTSIDEKLGNTDAYVTRQYDDQMNCSEEVFYRLVELVAGRKLENKELERLKQKNKSAPEEYKLTGSYDIGQIVLFPQGRGIILVKRPHNRIIAAIEDKDMMTYLEKGEGHSEIFRRPYELETLIPDAKGSKGPR